MHVCACVGWGVRVETKRRFLKTNSLLTCRFQALSSTHLSWWQVLLRLRNNLPSPQGFEMSRQRTWKHRLIGCVYNRLEVVGDTMSLHCKNGKKGVWTHLNKHTFCPSESCDEKLSGWVRWWVFSSLEVCCCKLTSYGLCICSWQKDMCQQRKGAVGCSLLIANHESKNIMT